MRNDRALVPARRRSVCCMHATTPVLDHDALAQRLYVARRDRRPIQPLTAEHDLDIDAAYRVQQAFVGRLLDDGGRIVGYKLGLTSAPMQQMLGVDSPDFAPVLSSMTHPDDARLTVDDFLQPKVEGEIALVLGADLHGPDVTTPDVQRAVTGATAAIEVVDSRIADWQITLVDTVADLASSGAIVLGARTVPIDDFDPRLVGMVMRRNGEVVATGAGAAALGDPLAAVAWLANTLAAWDVTLEAGHLIMTGALHAAFDVTSGDRIEATFDRVGPVSCHFD